MELPSHSFLFPAIVALVAWWLYRAVRNRQENPNNLPLPPGPKGYPIIGSLLDFPSQKPWLVYNDWFKIYGKLIPSLKLFGLD